MRIQSVTRNFGQTLLATAFLFNCVSCEQNSINKAKENASLYLTDKELNDAVKFSTSIKQKHGGFTKNPQICYWDSVLTSILSQKAYLEGAQMVKDSLAGKKYKTQKYDLPIKKEVTSDGYKIYQQSKQNVYKNVSRRDFLNLLKHEPEEFVGSYTIDCTSNILSYWNQITLVAAQRKAFNDGANSVRLSIQK